jgi:hypothetical protein
MCCFSRSKVSYRLFYICITVGDPIIKVSYRLFYTLLLEIQSSRFLIVCFVHYCWRSNHQKECWDPINRCLTLSYCCDGHQPSLVFCLFTMSYVLFFLCSMRRDAIVRFVYIGGIVNHFFL